MICHTSFLIFDNTTLNLIINFPKVISKSLVLYFYYNDNNFLQKIFKQKKETFYNFKFIYVLDFKKLV